MIVVDRFYTYVQCLPGIWSVGYFTLSDQWVAMRQARSRTAARRHVADLNAIEKARGGEAAADAPD